MGCNIHGSVAECWCDRKPDPPEWWVLGCMVLVVVAIVAAVVWFACR